MQCVRKKHKSIIAFPTLLLSLQRIFLIRTNEIKAILIYYKYETDKINSHLDVPIRSPWHTGTNKR